MSESEKPVPSMSKTMLVFMVLPTVTAQWKAAFILQPEESRAVSWVICGHECCIFFNPKKFAEESTVEMFFFGTPPKN